MKKLTQVAFSICLFGLATFSSQAYTSLYVFGDALSTTTNNTSGQTKYYYGGRFSNGRVWVEVLAQRQSIGISENWSYYDCGSADLVNNLKNFSISPSVASNALFVVWVDDADLYDEAVNGNGSQAQWTAAINAGQANELSAITTLYNKGVRTLIMPSVVDISQVPYFSQTYNTSYLQTMHTECIAYNTAFSNTLNQARAACPGLTIYEPNFFALLNDMLTNGASFGLTNVLYDGTTIDALDNLGSDANTNGLGDNYVYWDYLDPTAKLHEIMADTTEQMIAPVRVNDIVLLSPTSAPIYTNRLDVVNMPVGLNGFVDGTTNLYQKGWTWTAVTNITSTSTVQSLFVYGTPLSIGLPGGNGSLDPGNPSNSPTPTNAPTSYWQAYRLRFPMAWNWP